MTDDLPDELADLVAAERAAPPVDAASRAAVRARLAATVGHAPPGAAAAGGIARILAIVALTIGAGAATVAALRHHDARPTRARNAAAEPAAVVAAVRAPEAPAHLVAPPSTTPHPALVATPKPPERAPASPNGAVHVQPARAAAAVAPAEPAETALIRDAWVALSSNQPDRALVLVHDDMRLHPGGALAEERAALEVSALSALGRTDEARAAARAFLATYPNSVHRDRVAHALSAS